MAMWPTSRPGAKYEGEYEMPLYDHGEYHGRGKMTFPKPRRDTYEGEFEAGKRKGQGTYTFECRSGTGPRKIVGEFDNDEAVRGKYTWRNDNYYEGDLTEGGKGYFYGSHVKVGEEAKLDIEKTDRKITRLKKKTLETTKKREEVEAELGPASWGPKTDELKKQRDTLLEQEEQLPRQIDELEEHRKHLNERITGGKFEAEWRNGKPVIGKLITAIHAAYERKFEDGNRLVHGNCDTDAEGTDTEGDVSMGDDGNRNDEEDEDGVVFDDEEDPPEAKRPRVS